MRKILFYLVCGVSSLIFLSVLNSCTSIDKDKCTSEYIYSQRVFEPFDNFLAASNFGVGNVDFNVEEYASKDLKQLIESVREQEIVNSSPNFATGYGWDFNIKYEISYGDPYLGSQEELLKLARSGEGLDVELYFGYTIFYNNGRYKNDTDHVNVHLIYEDNDWFIDNIVYKDGDLRSNLNKHKF